MKQIFVWWQIAVLCSVALVSSCKKDDPVPPLETENKRVNEWILANMEREYYWNDDIPSDPDMNKEHMDFFESILSNKDCFSWIQERGQELIYNLPCKFQLLG